MCHFCRSSNLVPAHEILSQTHNKFLASKTEKKITVRKWFPVFQNKNSLCEDRRVRFQNLFVHCTVSIAREIFETIQPLFVTFLDRFCFEGEMFACFSQKLSHRVACLSGDINSKCAGKAQSWRIRRSSNSAGHIKISSRRTKFSSEEKNHSQKTILTTKNSVLLCCTKFIVINSHGFLRHIVYRNHNY